MDDGLMIAGAIVLSMLLGALLFGCDSEIICKTVVSLVQCAAIAYAVRKTGSAWCLLAMLCMPMIW